MVVWFVVFLYLFLNKFQKEGANKIRGLSSELTRRQRKKAFFERRRNSQQSKPQVLSII